MKTRILSGLTAAALVLALMFWGSFSLITTVVLAISLLAYLEYDKMFFHTKNLIRQTGVALLILLTVLAIKEDMNFAVLCLVGAFCVLAIYHVFKVGREGDNPQIVESISSIYLGYIYIVTLVGFILPIIEWPEIGRHYLLLLFLWVFIGDSAAYFAGRFFGKHTLASAISPKKTKEGALGAILSTFLVSLFWLYCMCPIDWDAQFAVKLLVFGPFLSVLAQLGDLFESMLKRSRHQKDSGAFLPGHGGILDRIDGLVFSTPAFYLFVYYILERPQ